MKTIYRLIGIFCFFLLLGACERKEIELYDSPRYLSFESNEKDTLSFSFFFTLDEEYEYPVIVNLTGDLLEEDKEFIVKPDTGSTLASEMFVLPERFIFPARYCIGYVQGKIEKSSATAIGKIVSEIEIRGNRNLFVYRRYLGPYHSLCNGYCNKTFLVG